MAQARGGYVDSKSARGRWRTGEEWRVNSGEQKQSGNPKVEISSAPRAPSGGEASRCRGHLLSRELPEVVGISKGLQCRK